MARVYAIRFSGMVSVAATATWTLRVAAAGGFAAAGAAAAAGGGAAAAVPAGGRGPGAAKTNLPAAGADLRPPPAAGCGRPLHPPPFPRRRRLLGGGGAVAAGGGVGGGGWGGGLLGAGVEMAGGPAGDEAGTGADRRTLADIAARRRGGERAQRRAAERPEQRALRHLLQIERFGIGEGRVLAAAGIRCIGAAREDGAAVLAGGGAGDHETACQHSVNRQARAATMGLGHDPLSPNVRSANYIPAGRPGNGIRPRESAAPAEAPVLASAPAEDRAMCG